MPDGYYAAQQAAAAAKKRQQEQAAADAQWKKVLQANAGGRTGRAGFTTDFENAGGYDGLRKMIEDADPGAMSAVSGHWGAVANSLQETAGELVTHVNTMLEHWTGATADAFRQNASTLHDSLVNGSQYAANTKNAMHDASVALSTAKGDFPGPPSDWDRFTSSFGASDVQFKNDAAQYGLSEALQKDGSQLSAWERVQQKAVVVMEQLGQSYNDATAQLGSTPGVIGQGGGAWPPPPSPPSGSGSIGSGGGTPSGPGQGGNVALKPITGGDGGGTDNFTPGTGAGGTVLPGGGGYGGIHGGQPPGGGLGAGGTLDGGPGGLRSGPGAGGGIGGGYGAGGVGGLGGGSGVGGGGLGGGGGVVGMGGLGSGLGGGGAFGGGVGSDGLGGGLAEGEGMTSGEGTGATGAAEGAAALGEGEGVAGGSGESGMGMGGMGGLGSQSGKKKQRKARAGYLVEDEETWEVEGQVNPGVITF